MPPRSILRPLSAEGSANAGHVRRADAALRERLRAIAQERRRFGHRRLHVLLRRDGFVVNHMCFGVQKLDADQGSNLGAD